MTEAQLYEIIGRLVVEADALRAALADALAVTETLTVEDAANAVGLVPADLVAEAEASAAAQGA